jgi:hypothetical protein
MRNFFTKESRFDSNLKAFGKLSKRQLVCLCCVAARSVLHVWEKAYSHDLRPRKAIEMAEQYLYGVADDVAVCAAASAAYYASDNAHSFVYSITASHAAHVAADAAYTAHYAECAYWAASHAYDAAYFAVNAGKPWDWLYLLYTSIYKDREFPEKYKNNDTMNIAKNIVATKEFSDMSILADALEDSGCDDDELLHHLRTDRGVWCVCDWALEGLTR